MIVKKTMEGVKKIGITALEPVPEKGHGYITYRCDDCGYVGSIRLDHFRNGTGCSVCSGKTVMPGVNDLATTNPELAKYVFPFEDAKTVSRGSRKKVNFRCDKCGCQIQRPVANLIRQGFRCPICYTGNSYPNRFVAAALYHFNICFDPEHHFTWASRYRYDFYLPDFNAIIEVHGSQHFKASGYYSSYNLDEIRERDEKKTILAKENDITSYYTIDARRSEAIDLKESIVGLLHSLGIEPTIEDWRHIVYLSEKPKAHKAMELWNNGIHSTSTIAAQLQIDKSIVSKYLQLYASCGLCDYDKSQQYRIGLESAVKAHRKPVLCTTTGDKFPSIREAAQAYGLCESSIQNCIAGRTKSGGKDVNGNKLYWEVINSAQVKIDPQVLMAS